MENTEQTTPQEESSFLRSLEQKATELTGLSLEDMQKKAEDLTGLSAEEIKAKSGELVDKIQSGDMLEEGKTMLNNLISACISLFIHTLIQYTQYTR